MKPSPLCVASGETRTELEETQHWRGFDSRLGRSYRELYHNFLHSPHYNTRSLQVANGVFPSDEVEVSECKCRRPLVPAMYCERFCGRHDACAATRDT